jgi:uncharacterized protein YidB (DUF937 family)
MPSLAALLGLVAIAGYQNREKIGEFVKGLTSGDPNNPATGMIDSVKKAVGSSPIGTTITGGLGELVDRFKKNGMGETADSWVGTGANEPVSEPQVEKALGPDLLDTIAAQTGLSREELVSRLSKILPDAVDKMTPNGRIPG